MRQLIWFFGLCGEVPSDDTVGSKFVFVVITELQLSLPLMGDNFCSVVDPGSDNRDKLCGVDLFFWASCPHIWMYVMAYNVNILLSCVQ